jgi:hypothetical protein
MLAHCAMPPICRDKKTSSAQCADQVLTAQVYGLPTLILFRDGEIVEGSKREGAIGKKGIINWMESNGVTNPQ